MTAVHCLADDLDHILAHTEGMWEELRGQRVFITGGSGFFGCWLLETFAWANERLKLGAEAVVLTRDAARFADKLPTIAGYCSIRLLQGDVGSFEFPEARFSHIIHAALDYSAPIDLFLGVVGGVSRTLDFALHCGAQRYLFTSSGAVYGRQPLELSHVGEDYFGAPDTMRPASAYGEAKRASEFLCAAYHAKHGLETTIARGFAFVGPYLPLDGGSAIGNFIGDALAGEPIKLNGDGTPLRSYLYGADLAIWLWTILFRGQPARPYNIGAEPTYSIAQVARMVAEEVNPGSEVQIAEKADPARVPERYVPSTKRARAELGLEEWIDVREGIRRTAAWQRRKGK